MGILLRIKTEITLLQKKYHVKLCEFKLNDDFCYIEEDDENLNFLLNFK